MTNKLLSTLPADDAHRVMAHTTRISLKSRQILYRQKQTITDVYFPEAGAAALMKVMETGEMAEIATIGNEGAIGSWIYLGDDISLTDVWQVESGDALKMSAADFADEIQLGGAFYRCIARDVQSLMARGIQTIGCNGLHSVQQRCSRWLLTMHDRVGVDRLKLTHELLSMMLGVRRPSITLTMAALQTAGALESSRGAVRIVDRRRLEGLSCECYRSMATQRAV